jgi:hypothetical protein
MTSRRRLLKRALLGAGVIAAGAATLLPRRANAYYSGPISDHFDGTRFFNPGGKSPKGLADVARLFALERWQPWPTALPSPHPADKPPRSVAGGSARLVLVGHATWLIQTGGRLCILGDSHVACLKLAWEERRASFPGLELTFFASRQSRLKELRIHGKQLRPLTPDVAQDIAITSGGATSIDPSLFDAFLVVGLGFAVPELLASAFYSERFLTECLVAAYEQRPVRVVVARLQKVTDKPILIAHAPLRAASENEPTLVDYETIRIRLASVVGAHNLTLVPQATRTIGANQQTKLAFTTDSPRLKVGDPRQRQAMHQEHDRMHMNLDYGRHFLDAVVGALPGAGQQ